MPMQLSGVSANQELIKHGQFPDQPDALIPLSTESEHQNSDSKTLKVEPSQIVLGGQWVEFDIIYNELRRARRKPISNLRRYIRWRLSRNLAKLRGLLPTSFVERMERRESKNAPGTIKQLAIRERPKSSVNVSYRLNPKLDNISTNYKYVHISRPASLFSTECGSSLVVIIPLYKNEHLIAPLFEGLASCSNELDEIDVTILIINDSPDHQPLAAILAEEIGKLPFSDKCILINNEANKGFIASSNIGLEYAREHNSDALLLNSDTILFPGAISEMRKALNWDPMVGFVNPRSNNATIATWPGFTKKMSPSQYFDSFQESCLYIPEFRFVPTGVGFCLYIKGEIISEFGLLDPVYGLGYNEENDYIMRAGRAGYRVVLANRAFVYHEGEASFSLRDESKIKVEENNARTLNKRYPEHASLLSNYYKADIEKAERLVSALAGEKKIAFDLSALGKHHNGTFELIKAICPPLCKQYDKKYQPYFIVDPEIAHFHNLNNLPNIVPPEIAARYGLSAICRIGQPFHWNSISAINNAAPVNIFFMLDTIALDCSYLYKPELDQMWKFVCANSDGLIFNSEFTKLQFGRRFHIHSEALQVVSHHSLDPSEYKKRKTDGKVGKHVLVVGNHFQHKYVESTVRSLAALLSAEKFVALTPVDAQDNVECYSSGTIPDDVIERLYSEAKIIIFPSHYEGFGFPIFKALAYEKPVFCRDTLLLRELTVACPSSNIYPYATTSQLCHNLSNGFPDWTQEMYASSGWDRSASEIVGAIDKCMENFNFDILLKRLAAFKAMDAS